MRFMLLLSFLVLPQFIFNASSQNKRPGYKLLWEVSGKGIRTSYVFGTMHTRDGRAFEFNDSVLYKLKRSEVFAMEIHPDSAMKYASEWLFKVPEKDEFKTLLSDKDYKFVDSIVRAKSNKTLADVRSPEQLTILTSDDMLSMGQNKKETFVDMYLYGLARRDGKALVGLEDAKDQMDAFKSSTAEDIKRMVVDWTGGKAEMTEQFNQMLAEYHAGDIDKLRTQVKAQSSPAFYRAIVDVRNKKMTAEIQKLITKKSAFIAIGAAHLPGPEGVLNLLRLKGYKVTLVQAPFTGASPQFGEEGKVYEGGWVKVEMKEAGYSVMMPKNPNTFELDSTATTVKNYVDLERGLVLQVIANVAAAEVVNIDETLTELEKSLRSQETIKIVSFERIKSSAGDLGIEYTAWNNDKIFVTRLFPKNNMIYAVQAGYTEEAVKLPDAKRFLNSVEFHDPASAEWNEFSDDAGAFAIKMPNKPVESKEDMEKHDSTNVTIVNHIFTSQDYSTGQMYFARYFDIEPGYVTGGDSVYYSMLNEYLMSESGGQNMKQWKMNVAGVGGGAFKFDVEEGNEIRGASLFRGLRNYTVFCYTKKEDSSAAIAFIKSMRLKDFKNRGLKEYKVNVGEKAEAAFKFPSPYTHSADATVYRSYDPNSGATFTATLSEISKYDKIKSWENYYDHTDAVITDENDVTEHGIHKHQHVKTMYDMNIVEHLTAIISGQWELILIARTSADYDKALVKEFMETGVLKVKDTSWDIFANKADVLLRDFLSEDTTVSQEAGSSLYSFEFEEGDLPAIYHAIEKLPVNEESEYVSRKSRLINQLSRINDANTLGFIEKIYPTLSTTNGEVDRSFGVLKDIGTSEAVNSIREKIRALPPGAGVSGYEIIPYDTVMATVALLPDMLGAINKFGDPEYIVDRAEILIGNGMLKDADKVAVQSLIIKLARENQNNRNADDEYYLLALSSSLGAVPYTKDVAKLVSAYAASPLRSVSLEALVVRALNGKKLNKKQAEALAKDPIYRIPFYQQLKGIGKTKMFPAKYTSDAMMAEGLLYQYLTEEDISDAPHEVQAKETMTAIYEGQTFRIHFFKYKYENGPWRLVGVGVHPNRPDLADERQVFDTYEDYDEANHAIYIENILKEFEIEIK